MLKYTLIGAAFGLMLIAPANAEDLALKCDEETITKLQTDIDAMTDAEKKATTVKELEMAREAMAGNKMDECLKHLDTAHQGARGGADGGGTSG